MRAVHGKRLPVQGPSQSWLVEFLLGGPEFDARQLSSVLPNNGRASVVPYHA